MRRSVPRKTLLIAVAIQTSGRFRMDNILMLLRSGYGLKSGYLGSSTAVPPDPASSLDMQEKMSISTTSAVAVISPFPPDHCSVALPQGTDFGIHRTVN